MIDDELLINLCLWSASAGVLFHDFSVFLDG